MDFYYAWKKSSHYHMWKVKCLHVEMESRLMDGRFDRILDDQLDDRIQTRRSDNNM